MKSRKHIAWLASALLTLVVALVLIGCPHNGMLSVDSGDNSTSGGRNGNNGLTLVITNFVPKTPAASGPARTISPDSINLTNQGERDKYIFLASGSNDGGESLPPTKVDVNDKGEVSLPIASGGTWTITIDAYEKTLLTGAPGGNMVDIDNPTPEKAKEIDGKKAECRVLTGTAVVVGTGTTVNLTLTNDGVGTEGNVKVNVNFDSQNDKTEIDNNKYKVKVALYNLDTGEIVLQGQGGGTTEQTVHDGQTNIGNPVVYNVSGVSKGRYQFRLTVLDGNDKAKTSWSDDIFIEGNRTTEKDIHITNLFKKPTQPTAFEAYWTPKETTELKDGFLAYLGWAGLDFNATGVDIEIADITEWYNLQGGNTDQVAFNGGGAGQALNGHDALWTEIDKLQKAGAAGGQAPSYEDVVTTLKWNENPQKATAYPAIWKRGSLLNGGDNEAVFLMQTGHVYSARIRAANEGSQSEWLILGDPAQGGQVTAPNALDKVPEYKGAGDKNPTKFDQPATNGLFTLVKINYKLNDNFLLYKTTDGNTMGDKATATDLVDYGEYKAGQKITLKLKYQGQNMTTNPQQNDWVLYPKTTAANGAPAQLSDRIMNWTGWCDETDTNTKFGPTEPTQNDAWKYDKHKDLTLIPLGASGTLVLKAETSGTFNVLDNTNVLVQIKNDENQVPTQDWAELQNGDDNPTNPGAGDAKTTKLSLMNDDANKRVILNLDNRNRTGTNGTVTVLYVSVGDDPTKLGELIDENQSPFTVEDIKVTLTKGSTTIPFVKDNPHTAHVKLDGKASGTYNFRVEILTSTGYWVSYQTDFALKYDNQTIQ